MKSYNTLRVSVPVSNGTESLFWRDTMFIDDEKVCNFFQECKHLSSRYRKVRATQRAVMQLVGVTVPELDYELTTLNKLRSMNDVQFRELVGIDEKQWNYVFRYIMASKV